MPHQRRYGNFLPTSSAQTFFLSHAIAPNIALSNLIFSFAVLSTASDFILDFLSRIRSNDLLRCMLSDHRRDSSPIILTLFSQFGHQRMTKILSLNFCPYQYPPLLPLPPTLFGITLHLFSSQDYYPALVFLEFPPASAYRNQTYHGRILPQEAITDRMFVPDSSYNMQSVRLAIA